MRARGNIANKEKTEENVPEPSSIWLEVSFKRHWVLQKSYSLTEDYENSCLAKIS
jgi:hypothetical protein